MNRLRRWLFGEPRENAVSQSMENVRRVRRIEIRTRKLVNEVFSGEYHSTFRGRGIEFSEVREYQPGDDIRTIDWNVTARAGRPFVKMFQEERELTVVFAVDVSGSMGFGTQGALKSELATELCAVLGMSALQNHDKLGLLLFSDRVEKFLRPRRGRFHALRIVREILGARSGGRPTRYEPALTLLQQVLKRRAVIFLVSDFLDPPPLRELALLQRRHEVVALRLRDPVEERLPSAGLVEFVDAESGRRSLVDTSAPGYATRQEAHARHRLDEGRQALRRARVDEVVLTTGQSFVKPLMQFFESRGRG